MKNITNWLIILLVLANIGTLSVFWLSKVHPRHPQQQPGGGPKDFLIRELKLSPAQQKQYLLLVNDHQKSTNELLGKIRQAKDDFFKLLKNPSVTDSLKIQASSAVSRETEKLDLLTFNHFQKLRALCTDGQKKKFDSIILEALNMMARPKPPGNGPPPDSGRKMHEITDKELERGERPVSDEILGPGDPEHRHRPPMGPPPEGGPDRHGPPPPGMEGMPPPN
jgi:protein CpxP